MVRREKGYRFMALRDRWNVTSLLLASTALLTLGAWPSASAEPHNGSIVVAQAAPPAEGEKKGQPPGKRPEQKAPPAAPPKGAPPPAPPQARPPAAPPQVQRPAAPPPT